MSNESKALLQRADGERRAARPYFAYRLYRRAAELTSGAEQLAALGLALEICREYFSTDALETIELARAISKLDPKDGRAYAALGAGLSIRSRDTYKKRGYEAALVEALESEAALRQAIELCRFDTDAWGTLGGLYKRRAQWEKARKEDSLAETYRARMSEAYRAGMDQGLDPYPTLCWLECHAIASPTSEIVPEGDRETVERALDVRRRQFARGEDAPWAAFDLARGQHYLKPNVPRFLHDLQVAIDETRRVAKRSSDRWMVETGVTSLRDLYNAEVPLDGLEEALLLAAQAVVDDGWVAGNWGPLGRPEDFLLEELRSSRAMIESVAQTSNATRDKLFSHIKQAEVRWSEADEERYAQRIKALDDETKAFQKALEPRLKKQLRVLWKLFGEEGLSWGLTAVSTLVPGAGLVSAAVPLVAKYVVHLTTSSE